ncbi:hypothetical protein KC19_8G020000, partial [Ceratodon purpureus]
MQTKLQDHGRTYGTKTTAKHRARTRTSIKDQNSSPRTGEYSPESHASPCKHQKPGHSGNSHTKNAQHETPHELPRIDQNPPKCNNPATSTNPEKLIQKKKKKKKYTEQE